MAADQRIGTYSCWSCGKEVPVKRKPSGKLSANCGWCDFPHYANEDTEHAANLLKATTLDAPKIDPIPKTTLTAKPEPAPAKRASSAPPGFGG